MERPRLPEWLKKPLGSQAPIHALTARFRAQRLNTVCEEAHCPNLGECWSRKTATFMILGANCTRKCGFCAVATDRPQPVDPDEPAHIAGMIRELGLSHAVITAVARDDLPDGGAKHFAGVISAVREENPRTTVEALTSDFLGSRSAVATVCDAGPDVFNHNIETVRSLTPRVRHRATYDRSLAVLQMAKEIRPGLTTKSGIMVGHGEAPDEVIATLADLRGVGCDIVTIGQYLQPSSGHLPVADYIPPVRFHDYEQAGLELGFKNVFAGPFVRSSYHAGEVFHGI